MEWIPGTGLIKMSVLYIITTNVIKVSGAVMQRYIGDSVIMALREDCKQKSTQ